MEKPIKYFKLPEKGFHVVDNVWLFKDKRRGTYYLLGFDNNRIAWSKYLKKYQASDLLWLKEREDKLGARTYFVTEFRLIPWRQKKVEGRLVVTWAKG